MDADPLPALAHPFFDDLKIPGVTLLDGSPLPRLFDFSRHGMSPLNLWVAYARTQRRRISV